MKLNMIKVLFIADNLSYGGAQKIITFVANNIDRNIFKVNVLNENCDIPIARPLNNDIKVYGHSKYCRRFFRRFQELTFLISLIKETNPDVLISFLDMPNFITTFAGCITHKPVIISERGDPGQKQTKLDKLIRLFENNASGAVFQTEGAKAYYPKKLQSKSVIIPNPVIPIKLSEEFVYNDKPSKIVSVGRFENAQKRQDLIVKAFAIVVKEKKNAYLNFYGSGPDCERIKKLVNELGISDNVFFYGRTKNTLEDMLVNDIYVLSSDYEGIPNTLIEAMSIGMPCVASDCTPGGARFLIKNGYNGLLIKKNSIEELSKAILFMIDNPKLAKQYGINAKQILNDFKPETIVKMWDNYILSIYNARSIK